ncbi:MAG: methylated-DNA--[protein]-cysteine S-methyltransferase [Parvularculaceae bacterium]
MCAIFFGDDDAGLTADLQKRFAKATIARAEHGSDFDIWVDQTLAAIDRPQLASNLPLDIQGTAFQEQVWRALQKVPAGTTATYKEVAEMIAKPSATRAVANACGANPVSVVIPCHRIVRSDGAVSGYHWGVERKRKLLTREKKLCTAK